LYPAAGLCDRLVETRQFPPVMAHRVAGRVSAGLLFVTLAVAILVLTYDLNAIASIGSAVALTVFALVTVAHLRLRAETGARLGVLVLSLAATTLALLAFVIGELIYEPASIVALIVILVLCIAVDLVWTRVGRLGRDDEAGQTAAP
jgi:L-asparagine transporter-like permease